MDVQGRVLAFSDGRGRGGGGGALRVAWAHARLWVGVGGGDDWRHPLAHVDAAYDRASPIYLADYATADDGTGIVHSAPAYGIEDFQSCRRYGMKDAEILTPVMGDGRYAPSLEFFGGLGSDRVEVGNATIRDTQLVWSGGSMRGTASGAGKLAGITASTSDQVSRRTANTAGSGQRSLHVLS